MSDTEKAQMMALGYKTKIEIVKLHGDLAKWEIFSRTFGWYQTRKKLGYTEEQVSLFKLGFEHVKQS